MEEYLKHLHRFGISDNEMNLSIYRFIPFENLAEILIDKRLTFFKVKTWEDPYENYLSKCKVYHNNRSVNMDLEDKLYGQCWTLTNESDALWRIYSFHKKGVRIKSTIQKLQNSILEEGQSFIGKVTYDTTENIKNHFRIIGSGLSMFDSNKLIETFLWKRKAFQHENEIRALYINHSSDIAKDTNLKQYSIDTNEFIEEICFDPRISPHYQKIYSTIVKNLGYDGPITKSNLYDVESVTITLN